MPFLKKPTPHQVLATAMQGTGLGSLLPERYKRQGTPMRPNDHHYQADYSGSQGMVILALVSGFSLSCRIYYGRQEDVKLLKYLSIVGAVIQSVNALVTGDPLDSIIFCALKVVCAWCCGTWKVIGAILSFFISWDLTLPIKYVIAQIVNFGSFFGACKKVKCDKQEPIFWRYQPMEGYRNVVAFSTACIAFASSYVLQGPKVGVAAAVITFCCMIQVCESAAEGETERNLIDDLIQINKKDTESKIIQSFTETTGSAVNRLSYALFKHFIANVSKSLGFGDHMFDEQEREVWYDRFDFNGDGTLDQTEAQKLVLRVLHEYRVANYGTYDYVEVQFSSPEMSGLKCPDGMSEPKKLGEGGQGAAFLYSQDVQNGTLMKNRYVAVKRYSKKCANAGGLEATKAEFALMKRVSKDSPYLARTFYVFQDAEFLYIVNEAYMGGDLSNLVTRAQTAAGNTRIFSEEWWRDIFYQCLRGVEALHKQCLVHCDIKERNIMVKKNEYVQPEIVLIDFGLATTFGGDSAKDRAGGTMAYMPPELFGKVPVWYPTGDIWSLGVVMFQLMRREEGWLLMCNDRHVTLEQLINTIRSEERPWHLLDAYPKAQSLVKHMLKHNYTARTWNAGTSRNARWCTEKCLADGWFCDITKGSYPDM